MRPNLALDWMYTLDKFQKAPWKEGLKVNFYVQLRIV